MNQETNSLNDKIQEKLENKIKKIFEEEGFENVSIEFGPMFTVHNSRTRSVEVKVMAKTEPKRIKP